MSARRTKISRSSPLLPKNLKYHDERLTDLDWMHFWYHLVFWLVIWSILDDCNISNFFQSNNSSRTVNQVMSFLISLFGPTIGLLFTANRQKLKAVWSYWNVHYQILFCFQNDTDFFILYLFPYIYSQLFQLIDNVYMPNSF